MGQNLDYGYGMFTPADNRPVLNEVADDEPVAMLIRYIGTEDSGLVAVAAGGDLTFTHGDLSSEAADTSLGIPSADGIIDVSNSSADTLGEVVDEINSSANWEAVLVDAKRADSSNDTLVTISATQAKVPKGLAINVDTSVALVATLLVAPQVFREDIRVYRAVQQNGDTIDPYFPFAGTRGEVAYVTAISDFASGTSLVSIETVEGANEATTKSVSLGTTLTDDTQSSYDRQNYPFRGPLGGKTFVRITGSAEMSAVTRVQVVGALKRTFA